MRWSWSRNSLLRYSLTIGSSLPPLVTLPAALSHALQFLPGEISTSLRGKCQISCWWCSKWATISCRGWLKLRPYYIFFFLSFQMSDWLHLQGKVNICTPIITNNLRTLISSMFRESVNLHRCRPTVCLLQARQKWAISIWKSHIYLSMVLSSILVIKFRSSVLLT